VSTPRAGCAGLRRTASLRNDFSGPAGRTSETPESLFSHDLIRKPVPTFRDHAR
jgi:hypothetical protein